MAELVVLQGNRKKLTEDQNRLVSQLEDVLNDARTGKVRGMVYATVCGDDHAITLGILNVEDCGIHELIGLSQMLNDRLLAAARDISNCAEQ